MKTSVDNFILSFDQFDESSRLEALEKIVNQLNANELNKLLNCVDYERLNTVTRLEVLRCLSRVFDMDQIEKALCILDTGFHETECKHPAFPAVPVVRTVEDSDGDNLTNSEDELRRDPAIIAMARGVKKNEIKAFSSKGRGRGMRRRRECATSDSDSESWDSMANKEENKQKMRKNKNVLEGRDKESRLPPLNRKLREETKGAKNKEPSLTFPRTVHNDGKVTITRHAEPRTILEEDGKIKVTRQMVTDDDEQFQDTDQKQPKSRSVFEQDGKITITKQIKEGEETNDECSELERLDSNLSPEAVEFKKSTPTLRTGKANRPGSHQQMLTQRATEEDSIMSQSIQWRQMRPQMMHPQVFQPPSTLHSAQQIAYNPFLGIPSDPRIPTSQYHLTSEAQYPGQDDGHQYQPVTESKDQFQFQPPTTGYYNPFLCELLNAHKQLAS